MYLKSLTLRGFKSFANATTLRFEPGITAVIGPNGSGKSNIVDALSWVMGEQGVKNLRGTSMEDVIFAGTSDRAPLGRAQVTLTIDNTDRTLDIDYTEVTISRTIFRNGGSEYAINGTQCRLLDIQELLSDTGLGQQMHVIVGQGRLDAILRADPSGHRAFIEEAAGILKHRKRKERALRKLDNTETNLSRLDDLLGEIHRQLGPLGRQARISRRAEGIQVALRDAQARLFAEDAMLSRTRRNQTKAKLDEERRGFERVQGELADVKGRIERLETLSAQSSPALSGLNQTWRSLSQIEERLRSVASLAGERSRSLSGQIVEHPGEDPSLLIARADELSGQAGHQQEAVASSRMAYDQATEARAGDEQRLASVRQTLAELRKSEQQRDARIANCRELVAREEAAVQLAETRAKDHAAQRAALVVQRDDAVQRRDEVRERQRNAVHDGGKAWEQARSILQDRQDALGSKEEQLRGVQGRMIALQSTADALNETLEGHAAAASFRGDDAVEVLGGLADFIRIEDGWQEAMARAMGDYADALVIADESAMLAALERVLRERSARVALLHPSDDDMNDDADDAPTAGAGVADSDGVPDRADVEDGPLPASRLIRPNSRAVDTMLAARVTRAVRLLLADTAAVSDDRGALSALRTGPWRQAVTPQGTVFNRVGAGGGVPTAPSDLSLVSRRDEALEERSRIASTAEMWRQEVEELRAARDAARAQVESEAKRRTEERLKARQMDDALQSATRAAERLSHQLATLDETLATTRGEGDTHRSKLEDLRLTLERMRHPDADGGDLDELEGRERKAEARLTGAREREVAAKLAWKESNDTLASLTRQQSLLRERADEAKARRLRIAAENERRRARIARMERIGHDATCIAGYVSRSVAEVTARREALQRRSSGHDQELKGLRARRNELETDAGQRSRREHELDVERERQAAEAGQLTQRISDALGMGVDELIAGYGPDRPVPVLDDAGRTVPREHREGTSADSDSESTAFGSSESGSVESTVAAVPGSGSEPGSISAVAETSYVTVPYRREEQVRRLEKARRDLKALGKVNPLATEEFDALRDRNQYLNDQRQDVASSRDDLLQLIRDLDATMTQAFASAFDDTAQAFAKVFATLFPGGTGRLRLENPDDMLTTGVVVEASPAGKRVKQLSLLSGGERSLTALALLFAIFTARPSPFYVMDEVEAALDSVNLSRLLGALQDLRSHAQLIIITHQQRTMAIADALYGITMRADGVTAVMSQRLDRSHGGPDGAHGNDGSGGDDDGGVSDRPR